MPAIAAQHCIVVMDPIDEIKPHKDTTLAMLLAAQDAAGRSVTLEQGDLWLRDGVAMGRAPDLQRARRSRTTGSRCGEPSAARASAISTRS